MLDVALYEPVDPYPHDGCGRALTPEQLHWQEDAARRWHWAGVVIRVERRSEHLRRHHRMAALRAGIVEPESPEDHELFADPEILALCAEMEQAVWNALGPFTLADQKQYVQERSPEPYRSQGWYEDWADYMVRLMKSRFVTKGVHFARRWAAYTSDHHVRGRGSR